MKKIGKLLPDRRLCSLLCLSTGLSIVLLCLTSCRSHDALKPMPLKQAKPVNSPCPKVLPNLQNDICGLYEVPLNWQQVNQTIDVFLRAFPFQTNDKSIGEAKGQLWVIDGGPGASGATFSDPRFVELVHEFGWDLYVPTHRGVGFSTHLDCGINYQPFDTWFIETCAERLTNSYSEDLHWFGAIGAAYDLNHLIENNNPNNLPVIMVGTSYGTFVTQRFIQLFESNIDAAILISGTSLNPQFGYVAKHQEETFKELLSICDKQADCRHLFPTSANDAAHQLINGNAWKNCRTTQPDEKLAPWIMGSLASSTKLRKHLALAIRSMLDCTKEDIQYLTKLVNWINEEQVASRQQLFQFNPLMLHHQILTELMVGHENNDKSVLPEAPLLLSPIQSYIENKHLWPTKLPPLDLPSQLDTTLPMLVLHGGLDMQATKIWFNELQMQLNKPNQYNILFPEAGHGTPNYTVLENGENCSWQIVGSFLEVYNNKSEISEFNSLCQFQLSPFRFLTTIETLPSQL